MKCVVCLNRNVTTAGHWCEPCWRNQGKSRLDDVAWAARRSRAFEARRWRKKLWAAKLERSLKASLAPRKGLAS
jgi:hypothetical protein